MGAPGLIPWITKKCKGSIKRTYLKVGNFVEGENPVAEPGFIRPGIGCDFLYIEVNALIHIFNARSEGFRLTENEEEFLNVFRMIDQAVTGFNPRKGVFLVAGNKIENYSYS